MKLACWPNQGWATIARIVEPGSRPRDGDSAGKTGIFEYSGERPGKWQAADGVWLQGYWCYDWYDEVIRVAAVDAATHRITLAAPPASNSNDPAKNRTCPSLSSGSLTGSRFLVDCSKLHCHHLADHSA